MYGPDLANGPEPQGDRAGPGFLMSTKETTMTCDG